MNIKQMLVSAAVAILFAPVAMAAPPAPLQDSALDKEGRSIMDARGNCVLTKWDSASGTCNSIGTEARTIYFDFNKSSIKPSEKAKLDSLIHAIKGTKHIASVDIVGHADKIGKSGYNTKLSWRRAEAVKAYLWHHGVKTRKVDLKAVGDKQSVTHCDPKLKRSEMIACLAADRRVVIDLNFTK